MECLHVEGDDMFKSVRNSLFLALTLSAATVNVSAQSSQDQVDIDSHSSSSIKSMFTALSDSQVVQYVYSGSEVGNPATVGREADPWQSYNRKMFAFNDGIDRYFLKPIATTYTKITPAPIRTGVKNVFRNLGEVPSIANGLLQGEFKAAAYDTTRLIVNTTVGIGGIFDVAGRLDLPATDYEDFGQTLAVWGFRSGPYVVLPILGPSTVRDGLAKPVDWYTDPLTYIDHNQTSYAIKAVNIVNIRAQLLPLEASISGDKYEFIRDAYLQRRAFLISNGEVSDTFGDEEFDIDDF
jgi:phospholipid-binding lipoprotein MlaA